MLTFRDDCEQKRPTVLDDFGIGLFGMISRTNLIVVNAYARGAGIEYGSRYAPNSRLSEALVPPGRHRPAYRIVVRHRV